MTHATGNTTWADYPSTSTLITAAKLEKNEGAIDSLYTSEYGAKTRTVRPIFVGMIQSNIALAANTHTFLSSGVTVIKDTDSGWVVPGGTTASYYQIPISGRLWDIYFRAALLSSPGVGGVVLTKIFLNGTGLFTDTIAQDVRSSSGGEMYPTTKRFGLAFSAGDKLYFDVLSGTAVNMGPTWGFTYPTIMVRDAGPA